MEYFPTCISGSATGLFEHPSELSTNINVSSTSGGDELGYETTQSKVGEIDWNRFQLKCAEDAFKPRPIKRFIVEGMVSEKEIVIFYGKYGHKKSFAAISLAVNVAAGEPWIGLKTKQSPVLYINEDSNTDSFQDRVKAAIEGEKLIHDIPFYSLSISSFNFFRTDGDLRALEYFIDRCGAKLVLIDTWAAVMAGANENSVEDNQPVINRLKVILEKTGVSIIFVHHMNKDGEMRGSTSIGAGCDSLIKITSPDSSDKITFCSEKLRHSVPLKRTAQLKFENDPSGNLQWYYLTVEPTSDDLNDKQCEIIQYAINHDLDINFPEFLISKPKEDYSKYQNAKNELLKKGVFGKNDEKSVGKKVIYTYTH